LAIHLRQHFTRLISTERRSYYRRGITRGLKIGVSTYAILILLYVIKTGIYQEEIEHTWPTPAEWSFISRYCLRSAVALQHPDEIGNLITDWLMVHSWSKQLIERLENPEIDGKGITERAEGGLLVEGLGQTGYDVSMKSEPWRRGYFQALMSAAKGAENLEGFLTDWKLKVSAPAKYVLGPSNPNPRTLPGRKKIVMHEEDCTPSAESPEVFYLKILTTNGFNTKQKVDAALAYADWLDYKGLKDTARDMYSWAMDIATSGLPHDAARVVNEKTGVLTNNGKDTPSDNVLRVSTALAVHSARIGELSTALSIFTSVLQARRALPEQNLPPKPPPVAVRANGLSLFEGTIRKIQNMFVPSVYPEAPPDGNEPPVRAVGSPCDEAGLMTNIGEIIYASSSRESGLAWTRDAVDLAESVLINLGNDRDEAAIRERCSECLKVGFENWKTMVRKLVVDARQAEEEAIRQSEKAWFGGERNVQNKSQARRRWEAEDIIVQDRANRVLRIADEYSLIGNGPGTSIF
jgi:hypothetical protein